jgi:hypothetical protein
MYSYPAERIDRKRDKLAHHAQELFLLPVFPAGSLQGSLDTIRNNPYEKVTLLSM